MRGLFSLCLCIFLINQLLFETAAAARCPGGYNTGKGLIILLNHLKKLN
uniref:Uncharacterized protein n=1 Tax=Meloidogyne enterolobii TaxID=390850 RepID=A0A6V7YCK5_MELEN|nr:unnamed protein product [Meloidogyne enterolobii]